MNVYASVFRLRLASRLQYRVAALAGIATQFFWGFMLIMVFLAFRASDPLASPMDPGQLASYIWLQQAFLTFVMLWYRDTELFELIVSGNIAYELARPWGLYPYWYAKLLAQRVSAAALRCLPILAVAWFLPDPYRLLPPAGLSASLLFVPALLLGLLVQVSISMFIYILTCVTMSPYATMIFVATTGEFCAGMIIPLPFMPEPLRNALYLLPFRFVSDFPFRLYSGHIAIGEAAVGIAMQLGWLALLVTTGNLAMRSVLKRVSIQGG